ncbi:MAG TPA: transketolase family protein [Epulopiscium sp.]|nr:transketolase family protein [Candidatus Epulonipiscium sp.]
MANKKAIRDAYGETLVKLGKDNKNIVVLDADVSGSTKSGLFGAAYPERFFNVGIAEAGMTSMAGGLSTTGKIPFVNTFAAFLMLRAADPIRSNICYASLNVKLAGAYAGLSDSYDGATHHALEDISFMRSMPNMTVISVCDAIETEKAVEAAVAYNGPVYLRLSRAEMPYIFDEDYTFEIGKGVTVADGTDVTIIATGYMVHKALEAKKILKADNINARVINIHTIKPIDKDLIIKCAEETGAIVTAEEHNIHGGLGSAVAEVLVANKPVPQEFIAVQDSFTESGDYEQLLDKYGLQARHIVEKVKKVMGRK